MIKLIKDLLKIGTITNAGKDNGQLPSQQVGYHGKNGNGIAWYPYGYHAIAAEESYALIITFNGNNEERVHIPTSMLSRPTGEVGEVFLHHPKTGTSIKLDNQGDVTVNAVGQVNVNSPTLVRVVAPLVEVEGDLDVSGSLGVGGDTLLSQALTVLGDTQLTEEVMSGTIYIGGRHVHLQEGTGSYTAAPEDP